MGSAFLTYQNGTVKHVKHWVGVLKSPDGWQTTESASPDFVRKELIYSGKSGSTVEINYREFRGALHLAAPSFYQSIKYDLNESSKVNFQNFRFEILDATNSMITIKILSD